MRCSILTVCLDAGPTIEQTTESVLAQAGVEELEYLVVDGASSDDTLARLEPYRGRITHILSEPDQGPYDAMNKGIELATGDAIGILNAGDRLADEHVLAEVLATLEESGADAVYADLDYVDEEEGQRVVRRWRSGAWVQGAFLRGWMPPHPTLVVRRELFERYGGFELSLESAADYELMLRFFHVHGARLAYLPRVTVKMRVGGRSNASLRHRLRANREDREAWRLNGLTPPPLLRVRKPLSKLWQFWS